METESQSPILAYVPSAVSFRPSQECVQQQDGWIPKWRFNGTHSPCVGSISGWLYYCGPLTRFTAWVYLFCCHDYQVMYSRSSQQFLLMMVTFRDAIIILHPPLPVCHRPECLLSSVKCWEKMLRKPLREMAGLRIGFQTPVWDPITLLLEPGMQPDI